MTYEWDNKKPTAQMLGRWQEISATKIRAKMREEGKLK